MISYTKPYKDVLPSKIQAEVNASEDIIPECIAVSTSEDEDFIEFEFDGFIGALGETALDIILDAHDPTPPELAITALLVDGQKGQDHRVIDYKSGLNGSLHKVVIEMYRGEVREVHYYTDETQEKLVLVVRVCSDENCETLGYSRNPLGQPIERWTERTWYMNDGVTPHPARKVTHKVYSHDPVAQMKEGVRRRTNTIDQLSIDLLRAYVGTMAENPMNPTTAELDEAYAAVTSYSDKYEKGISTFMRTGRNDFLRPPESPNVLSDPEGWLNNNVVPLGYPAGWTIRTIILESVKNISE